jgi:GNAT superfamily N-acetyltransferase
VGGGPAAAAAAAGAEANLLARQRLQASLAPGGRFMATADVVCSAFPGAAVADTAIVVGAADVALTEAEAFHGPAPYSVWSRAAVPGPSEGDPVVVMWRSVVDAGAPGSDAAGAPVPDGLDVRVGPEAGPDLADLAAGFGMGHEATAVLFPPALFTSPGVVVVVGSAGGRPVTGCCLLVRDGVAGIYGGVTSPELRGRSLGAALLGQVLLVAVDRGAAAVVTHTATARSLLARAGFDEVDRYRTYRRPA